MDNNRIIKVLKNALSQGVSPGSPTADFNPKSFMAYYIQRYHIRTVPKVIDTVVEGLKREKDLAIFDGGFMNTGGGGGARVELRDLAEWLLAGTIASSAEKVVEHLDRFIKSEVTPAIEVLALCGVRPEEQMELADNVRFIPISQLPRSHEKDAVQGIPMMTLIDLSIRAYQPRVTAAIVIKRNVAPKFLTDEPGDSQLRLLSDRTIWDICQCITLLGPSAPTPISHWFQLEEWVPLALKGSGAGRMIHEILPNTIASIPKAGSKELICKFLSLSSELKTKLKVPIDRLNLSIRRSNNADKAIELGIALESFLTKDRDKDAPISYLLRLRGSFLGGDTPDDRLKVYKTLNSAYGLRSQAVHLGALSKKGNPDETLAEGALICAELIRRIIERGSFPDWDQLIFGPQKPNK